MDRPKKSTEGHGPTGSVAAKYPSAPLVPRALGLLWVNVLGWSFALWRDCMLR